MKTWIVAIGIWLISVCAASAQALLDLPDLNPSLADYQSRVVAKANADQRRPFELFRQVRDAMAQGKSTLALDGLEVLAGKNRGQGEGGAQTWVRLALAWQAQSSRREQPPGPAIAAAYGAYKRAQGQPEMQIEALSLLGNLLMRVARIKELPPGPPEPAPPSAAADGPIENVELARRLAFEVFSKLSELAPGRYDRQKERTESTAFFLDHIEFPPPPRRMASGDKNRCDSLPEERARLSRGTPPATTKDDERVPADSSICVDRPHNHTCLVFTRNLGEQSGLAAESITIERIDLAGNRIPVRQRPAAISANTICYADLSFGAKYEFLLTRGLRADNGAPLVGPLVAELDMPQRPPSLGFLRGAYVMPSILPGNAPHTIHLRSVNLKAATLKLRRIGDRNLIREIVTKHVIGGAAPQDACLLLNEISETIADGTLTMSNAAAEEKAYALPVGDILKARAEWLSSYRRGSELKHERVDANGNALSLVIKGDEAAAGAAVRTNAGAFILFGKIEDTEAAPDDYGTSTRNTPCVDGLVSQWFVITNIGLTLQRTHAKLYVVARELDTGAPIRDLEIQFLSKSGAVIASEKTRPDGMAEIDARLGRGTGGNALIAVMAYRDNDFAFLDMTSDAIDLVDRGLDGAAKLGEFNAFIMPSRGIFRPGETIEAVVLVRGPDGAAVRDLPAVEMALSSATDTPLLRKQTFSATQDGGFLYKAEIPKSATEGSLKLTASVLNKVVGSTTVEVQHYKPLTVQLTDRRQPLAATVNGRRLTLSGTVRADYLYGLARSSAAGGANSETDAPAADLRGELQVRVEPTPSPLPGCFEGFTFGHAVEDARAQIFRGPLLPTNAQGEINIQFPQDGVLESNVPMRAATTITLFDANGRAAQRTFDVPIAETGRRWLGLKPLGPTAIGVNKFEFILLDDNKRPLQAPVDVTVIQEHPQFVWTHDGAAWIRQSMPSDTEELREQMTRLSWGTSPSPGRTGEGRTCPPVGTFEYTFDKPGQHIVRVTEQGGGRARADVKVSTGGTTAPDGYLKPDGLRVSTRAAKDQFAPGEEITVDIETPHSAGWVLVEVVIDGKVEHSFEAQIRSQPNATWGQAQGTFRVGNWRAGAMHIYATSFRKFEDARSDGPGRAIGGIATQIGATARRPALTAQPTPSFLRTSDYARGLSVTVTAPDLAANARFALAIVDEGILQLTEFKVPDPYDYFFRRRGLGMDVFDNYGRVLYGRQGGDGPLPPLRGVGFQPSKLVKWHSGIRQLSGNRAEVQISAAELDEYVGPHFQGRLKIMVWAWDGTTAAKAESDLTVRDDVIARLAVPQFMTPGDTALLPLRVINNLTAEFDRQVEVRLPTGLSFAPELAGASAGEQCRGSPSCQLFRVTARRGVPGVAQVPIRLTAERAEKPLEIGVAYNIDASRRVPKTFPINVRPATPPTVELVAQPEIARDRQRTITRADVQRVASQKGLDVNTLRLGVRISRNGLLPPPPPESEVLQLEQLTSMVQLLIVTDQQDSAGGAARAALIEQVNQLVSEITSLQKPSGEFTDAAALGQDSGGYVADRGSASRGAAAFVLDVLARARTAGAVVDDGVIDRSTAYLLSAMRTELVSDPLLPADAKCTRADVYTLTVLARLNRIGPASFRSFTGACEKAVGDDAPMKLLLAAAYGAYGFMEQAQAQLASAGLTALPTLADSPVEARRVGALLLESGLPQIDPSFVLTRVGLRMTDRPESLVTSAWLARVVSAALTIIDRQQPAFSRDTVTVTPESLIARVTREGMELRRLELAPLPPSELGPNAFPASGIQVVNRGQAALQLSYVMEGVPLRTREPFAGGIGVRRIRVGGEIGKDLEFKQFETAYFTVEINQTDGYVGEQRLAAVQLLPAGFEGVDHSYQPSWRTSIGDVINEAAIRRNKTDEEKATRERDYAEFQDDRWIVLPRSTGKRETHLVAFSVRPTLSGEFVLPPIMVRDLNNPQRIAWTQAVKVVVTPAK